MNFATKVIFSSAVAVVLSIFELTRKPTEGAMSHAKTCFDLINSVSMSSLFDSD